MKIYWNGRTHDGRYEMKAEPGEYDGIPPISSFLLDKEPLFYNDDIMSVASVLLFGEYTSGWLSTPRKVSPEVAEAIQTYLHPTWVGVSPVEFEPRANPSGEGTLLVTNRISMWGRKVSKWGEPRTSTICVLPASEFAGGLASPNGLFVASNAHLLGMMSVRQSPLLPSLAAALLFCETFRASSIMLEPEDDLSEEEFRKVRDLLASCKISLHRYKADASAPTVHAVSS